MKTHANKRVAPDLLEGPRDWTIVQPISTVAPKKDHLWNIKAWLMCFSRRQVILASIVLAIIIGAVGLMIAISGNNASPSSTTSGLNFKPLAPLGEAQLASLGSQAFNKAHDSYTYDDLYLGVPIRVSEQPLPKGFPDAAVAVAKAASSLQADITINTNSGLAYISSSDTYAKQAIVFSKGGLLIFIQSSQTIERSAWPSYINNLK
ncbi:MAG: hypothetical protein ACREF7_03230 [Candidatus Saccharimonadales bacterium]